MTPGLARLQADFFAHATRSPSTRVPADELFQSANGFAAADRIDVYADMFLWRQVDSLREDFPVFAALLGDDFAGFAGRYLEAHPSTHPSLARLGHALPAFARDAALVRPDAADVAALEWARCEVFDELQLPVAEPSLLATAPEPAALRFAFQPALRVLELSFDAVEPWRAVEAGEPAPAPHARAQTVAVWRRGFDVRHAALEPAEAAALAKARAGAPLGELCAAFPDVPTALAAVGSWFAEHWIAAP